MAQAVSVLMFDAPVGRLEHDRGRLSLSYDNATGVGVSARLPVQSGASYSDAACHHYFANLLPEGSFRETWCRNLSLPVGDDFGLLRELGRDCAGAVGLRAPDDANSGAYSPLPEAELRRWLTDPAARPSPEKVPGLRASLAGAQDKLVVHVAEGEAYLCEHGAPSSVILKPDIRSGFSDIELSALNELFCMQLAGAVGLRVPRTFWFAGALAVERFDRSWQGSKLSHVHQEDFAQLLGLPHTAKYDIGWRQCFELLSQHVRDPSAARAELLERLFFNLFIGNGDGHGKNFSLSFGAEGAELAPGYDLLCTQVYPSLTQAFAMRVGPARRQEELSPAAFAELGRETQLDLVQLKQRGCELSTSIQAALRDLPERILSQNPSLQPDIRPARRRDDFLRKLVDVIVGNCKRIARVLQARG